MQGRQKRVTVTALCGEGKAMLTAFCQLKTSSEARRIRRRTVIAKEGDDCIVAESNEVNCIAEEEGDPVNQSAIVKLPI